MARRVVSSCGLESIATLLTAQGVREVHEAADGKVVALDGAQHALQDLRGVNINTSAQLTSHTQS